MNVKQKEQKASTKTAAWHGFLVHLKLQGVCINLPDMYCCLHFSEIQQQVKCANVFLFLHFCFKCL